VRSDSVTVRLPAWPAMTTGLWFTNGGWAGQQHRGRYDCIRDGRPTRLFYDWPGSANARNARPRLRLTSRGAGGLSRSATADCADLVCMGARSY